MGNQNGVARVETPCGEKRLLPRRANANISALGWGTGLWRSSPCFPQGTAASWMGSWMACLGLSKLKPAELKPTHCQHNKWQQCRRGAAAGAGAPTGGSAQSSGKPRGTSTCGNCPSSTRSRGSNTVVPLQDAGRYPTARLSASWPGWEECGAPEPCGDWWEERGHPHEERPAEGKLQEQFSSTREAAAQRKDMVCSPCPWGQDKVLNYKEGDPSWTIRKPSPMA